MNDNQHQSTSLPSLLMTASPVIHSLHAAFGLGVMKGYLQVLSDLAGVVESYMTPC